MEKILSVKGYNNIIEELIKFPIYMKVFYPVKVLVSR